MPIKENAALTDFTNVQTIVLNTFSFPKNIIYEHYNRDIQKTVSEKACPPHVMSLNADFPAAVQDITLYGQCTATTISFCLLTAHCEAGSHSQQVILI